MRAFRTNEKLREKVLPLLGIPGAGLSPTNVLSSTERQTQQAALEKVFERMDADGSNEISRNEFEGFFAALSTSSISRLRAGRFKVNQARGASHRVASVRRRFDPESEEAGCNLAELPDKKGSRPLHQVAASDRAHLSINRLLCRSYGQTWREMHVLRSDAAAKRREAAAGVTPASTPGPLSGCGSPEAAITRGRVSPDVMSDRLSPLTLPPLPPTSHATEQQQPSPPHSQQQRPSAKPSATIPAVASPRSCSIHQAEASVGSAHPLPQGSTRASPATVPGTERAAGVGGKTSPSVDGGGSNSFSPVPPPVVVPLDHMEGTAIAGMHSTMLMTNPAERWRPRVTRLELASPAEDSAQAHPHAKRGAESNGGAAGGATHGGGEGGRGKVGCMGKHQSSTVTAAQEEEEEEGEEWMKQYIASMTSNLPSFSVSLHAEAEYTKRYTFKPGNLAGEVTAEEGMVSWVAAKGSKVGQLIGLETFELADGTILRLYKKGEQRNARPPRDESAGSAPGGDDNACGAPMPVLAPTPAPSRRDLPRLGLSVHLQYPQPVKHTLPYAADGSVANEDVWYGTIGSESMLLGVRQLAAVEATSATSAPDAASHDSPPFVDGPIDDSCFAARRSSSDSRSYFNGQRVTQRAIDIDFARCNGEKFRALVARESGVEDGEEQAEIDQIRNVLQTHRHAIYAIYAYYCVNGTSNDRFVLGLNEFGAFCRECSLADESSRYCHQTHIDAIFVASDAEERGGRLTKEQKLQNERNLDRALMRFEWLQALVRVATVKYAKEGHTASISLGLERLISEDMLPNVPEEAMHDADVFRRERLYTHEVAATFHKHEPSLKALYTVFSATKFDSKQKDTHARATVMELDEWTAMLSMAGVIDDDFTKRHASLCFIWSQSFCTDDLKRRRDLVHMKYVDFLEALARVTTFKPLPTALQLAQANVRSCAQFMSQPKLVRRELRRSLRWQEEEVATSTPLEEPLEMLLSLIVERLDGDGNGVLRVAELKKLLPS